MSVSNEDIESVRGSIASLAYNDCLPTALSTNVLHEICHQYDNYKNAREEKKDIIDAMRMNIELLNRQSVATGIGNKVLYPKSNNDEDIVKLSETVATIYAIPYKANLEIDYVGYAYGTIAQKIKSMDIYKTYRPDAYMNQCNRVILEKGNEEDAKNMYNLMIDTVKSFKAFMSIKTGESTGSEEQAREMLKARISYVDRCIENLGGEPEPIQSKMHAKTIAACMNSDYEFSKKDAIENMRSEGIFRDTEKLMECVEF